MPIMQISPAVRAVLSNPGRARNVTEALRRMAAWKARRGDKQARTRDYWNKSECDEVNLLSTHNKTNARSDDQ